MKTITKKTGELQAGDVVWNHGMRLLIEAPLVVSDMHPKDGPAGPCRFTAGGARVLNMDDLEDEWLVGMIRTDDRSTPDRPAWSIQGNDFATWAVEVSEDRYVMKAHLDGWMVWDTVTNRQAEGWTVSFTRTLEACNRLNRS